MTCRSWLRPSVLILALCALGTVAADSPLDATADAAGVRLEFIAALERVRQHAPDLADSAALQGYALYDYLTAARLHQQLASSPSVALDDRIDIFVRDRTGQPVARSLAHDWLLSLARRGRWDWFLPRAADAADPALVCDRLAGRLATADMDGLADAALALWSAAQKSPPECATVFAWLRTQGLLTAERAALRTRKALEAGNARLARTFVVDVPSAAAEPLWLWIELLEAPRQPLTRLAADGAVAVEPEALSAGFNRLSIADPAAAASLLPRLLQRPQVSEELRNRLQRGLALGAAYGRVPGAEQLFRALAEDADDLAVQEWRVRAALWAGDFAQALTWMERMPAGLSAQPRWRYWHARALGAIAGAAAAAPGFGEIAGLRDYYGYLAADRLGRDYSLNMHPSRDDLDAQAALAELPSLVRAHELFAVNMPDDAGAEWSTALAGSPPATRVQAARLAARWGWYAQTIATLAQAGDWDDVALRYPRPFAPLVAAASQESRIPVDWLYAVMRQESLFRVDAVSHADARGLMQMQPATAATVARQFHLPAPTRDGLLDPRIAIPLGACYLRQLLDKYAGQLQLALAAYNAGPAAVARWQPPQDLDADVWIENIPYAETRSYVQHIAEHVVAFAATRDAPPPRLSTLLRRMQPAAAAPP